MESLTQKLGIQTMNDTQFSQRFKDINGLTWLPWVGVDYLLEQNKILVLGESHYCYNNYMPRDIEADKDETIKVVTDYAEKGRDAGNQYKTYEQMDAILRQVFYPNARRQDIWSKIAFMNIVQKCMDNNQARPQWQDFLSGWQVILQVINVLKPDVCLCFSTDKMHNRVNFNRLEEFKPQIPFDYSIQPTQDTQKKISRCIVATPGGITIENSKEVPVIFVQHASRIKNINEWCKVIETYKEGDSFKKASH